MKSRPKPLSDRNRKMRDERLSPRSIPVPERSPGNVIYGILPVIEALRASHRRIDKVFVAKEARINRFHELRDLCREKSIALEEVPRDFFSRYVEQGANHQGLLAFVASAAYTELDDILANASSIPLILVLDGVEDPRNLGAILRVAECSGVDGVIIPERRAVGLTDTVAKASAGAVEIVKVARTVNINRSIERLKKQDIWVIGTSVDAETSYVDWDWTRPTALVLGGEGRGLHQLVAENCDMLVKIPMYGKIDSLNVSVAAGVILFEARRQRDGE